MRTEARWWESRRFAALLVLAAALPLLGQPIPPLTDLFGHMARYHVALEIGTSPTLGQWFAFRWLPVGNLGVDLLVVALAPLMEVEAATKLVVATIPPLAVAGMLLVAREAHGRIPATAPLALPFAHGAPFQYGFVNFSLGIAIALLAIGLWLRLGRLGRFGLRAGLFVPIGLMVWLAHSFAWGVLGLAIFGIELVEARRRGVAFTQTPFFAAAACLPLVPPLLPTLFSLLTPVGGVTTGYFDWPFKWLYLLSALRHVSPRFDMLCVVLLLVPLLLGLRGIGIRYEARLAAAAGLLLAAFLVLPSMISGSAFADMRLAPWMLAIGLLALMPQRHASIVALLAIAFFAVRMTTTAHGYWQLSAAHQAQLAALDHVPRGARMFVLADGPCSGDARGRRMDHLGAMAVVRRDAFVNGVWEQPGSPLLTVRAPLAGWTYDPTQMLQPASCRLAGSYGLTDVLARLPRASFDYLWLIDLPRERWPADPGLYPVWAAERGVLYRIAHPLNARTARRDRAAP